MGKVCAAAGLLASLLTPPDALAAVFSHPDLCPGFRLVRRGPDLHLVCPDPRRGLIVAGWFDLCGRTSAVLKSATGELVITCLVPRPRG